MAQRLSTCTGHGDEEPVPDILVFLAILFVLALAWGYVMQKTEALWGSVLFHAGADLMIILGIYKTYGILIQARP